MILNGIKIKKYRTRVKAKNTCMTAKEIVDGSGYKIVEGYVSILAVVIPDGETTAQYVPIFVSEEVDIHSLGASGMGKSIFAPVNYAVGDFEILGEVE